MKIFSEIEGKWTERAKIEGEITNLWSMTKKGHQKFLRMKIKIFFRKRKNGIIAQSFVDYY